MAQKKGGKRRVQRYVYNDSTPRFMAGPKPEAVEAPKELGTIRAQLIAKHGSRGFGRLLADLREQAVEA